MRSDVDMLPLAEGGRVIFIQIRFCDAVNVEGFFEYTLASKDADM